MADGARAAVQRLRPAVWAITQTSVAAGLAWYLTHDLLHHRQPFFAPISAVVCMSATNVQRARRAAQMIVGVALGIVLGGGIHAVLGTGPAVMAAAVFVALGVAVLTGRGFIAQGLMFVNQTAVSAVLVLVFASTAGLVAERLFDAVIGGGLALIFAIVLFPPNPVQILCDARADVLAALHATLVEVADVLDDPAGAAAGWPRSAFDRLHDQLSRLAEARTTAVVAARAPRRWAVRNTFLGIEQQSARLAMLVSGVLQLPRAVTRLLQGQVPTPVHIALTELAAGMAVADDEPATATAHAAAARDQARELEAGASDKNQVVLADVICACADDLQQLIDLPSPRK
ncbi:hypothetical protein B1987_26330 [Mycobacterium kansasii]|uniref:Integral membrane bound transporter domain-containing protein n=1 Tax=Mycobacterium attenuatum TaxID=2341086 RepID=A0A498PY47_9MYCO|nr:FUSC family protein [Mycobacterium attenuatum]ORB86701.1 hypothetical protein B1987_26330 [Mycobacterium kansasii]VBA37921.1 hypothetical protein LAUMK136_02191 [Mycobacterium attenuatum]